jgi:hypothetical protein
MHIQNHIWFPSWSCNLLITFMCVPVQRAEKVQQARLDLQERIKSIRSLVHSTTKKTNDFSSPSFPVEKYAAVKNLARSPAGIEDRLPRDVEQFTLSEDDALWRGGNARYLRVQQQESPDVARTVRQCLAVPATSASVKRMFSSVKHCNNYKCLT